MLFNPKHQQQEEEKKMNSTNQGNVITVEQSRNNGMLHIQQTLQFKDPLQAICHLATAELAYGGRIIDLDPKKIEVQTRVNATCVDMAVFKGSEEMMKPLLAFIALWTQLCQEHGQERRAKDVAKIMEITDGKPVLVSMLAPFMMNTDLINMAILLMCEIQDETDVAAALKHGDIGDVVAAHQLAKEGACTFREALAI